MKSLPEELGGQTKDKAEETSGDTLAALQALVYEGEPAGESPFRTRSVMFSFRRAHAFGTRLQKLPLASRSKGMNCSSSASSKMLSGSTRARSTK